MCPNGSAGPEKDMTQDRSANGQQLKIVIVGDGGCGKTSLLMVYAKGDFPEVKTTHFFFTQFQTNQDLVHHVVC